MRLWTYPAIAVLVLAVIILPGLLLFNRPETVKQTGQQQAVADMAAIPKQEKPAEPPKAEPAPAPTPEPPKPEASPLPGPEVPKPAEAIPSPVPEAPKAETPPPAEKKAEETVVPKKQDRLPVPDESAETEPDAEPVDETEDEDTPSVQTVSDTGGYEYRASEYFSAIDSSENNDSYSDEEEESSFRSNPSEYGSDDEDDSEETGPTPGFTAHRELQKTMGIIPRGSHDWDSEEDDCPPGIHIERRRPPRLEAYVHGGIPPWITTGVGIGPGPQHHRRHRW